MLKVSLLGEFSIKMNDSLIQVNASRLQSLLAYLFLNKERSHSRAYLAGLFWPETNETQARTNLRNLLHQFRHTLPELKKYFNLGSQTIYVNPDSPIFIDVDVFGSMLGKVDQAILSGEYEVAQKALEDAISMYLGDLLLGCYDDWIIPKREHLRQEYQNALENLANLVEDKRDYQSAIRYARYLLQQDPLREASYRRLIRLYAIVGDRTAALRVYHSCATILQRELSVQPGAATQQIYEQLLGPESQPLKTFPASSTFSHLVGREKDWKRLLKAWYTASGGKEPHVVMLRGEAGIGKTRLMEELLQWAARQGIFTANAHCYAAEGELAYSPVVAWLRANPVPPVNDVWLTEAAHVLPEILVNRPDLPKPKSMIDAWQREHLFTALAHIFMFDNQPLLLEIDDLQWCDRDSLEFLHFLVRFQRQPKMLIVGAYRPEEIGSKHPLIHLLDTMRTEGELLEIDLHCLDEPSTHALITGMLGKAVNPGIAQRIFQDTEGNPLFVVETVQAILPFIHQSAPYDAMIEKQALPPKVHSILNARLAQLSRESRELAEFAAVIGKEFNVSLLLHISERNEENLVRQMDELWRRRVVREQGTAFYDFSHDKLREVAYNGMSEARRRFVHRRTAQTLESVYAQNIEPVCHQVAVHYERAGMVIKALPYYLQAAQIAHKVFANEEAINLLQHGLDLLTDPLIDAKDIPENLDLEFWELLSDIYALKRDHALALGALQRALNLINPNDLIRRARLERKIGVVKREQRLYGEELKACQLAEQTLGDQPIEDATLWWDEWLEIKVEQVWAHYWLAEWPEMNELVEQLQPIIQTRGSPAHRLRFLMASCLLHLRKGRYVVSEEMLHHSYEALTLSQDVTSLKTKMECNFEYGFLNLWCRKLDEAEKHLDISLNLAEKTGILPYQTLSLTYLTILYRFKSDLEFVQAYAKRAHESAIVAKMPDYIASAYGNDAWVAWRNGSLTQTRQLSDKAIEIWQKSPLVYPFQWIAYWPRLGAAFVDKKEDKVWNCVQKILEPPQQIFPENLDIALGAALQAKNMGLVGESNSFLNQAIKLAKKMGYL